MTSILDIIAILLGLTALFGWLNHRFIGLPMTIGMVVFGLVSALLILAADALIPGVTIDDDLIKFLKGVDFYDTLMKGMLGFLLFAGALHVDLNAMIRRRYAITLMATFGVLLSTALVGAGAWLVFQALGLDVPFMVCLVLGALISPTDPVAVMGVLKIVKVPPSLEAKIAGESLFNDGVGVVVFAIVVALAFHTGAKPLDAADVAILFIKEAAGGAILGIDTGGALRAAQRRGDPGAGHGHLRGRPPIAPVAVDCGCLRRPSDRQHRLGKIHERDDPGASAQLLDPDRRDIERDPVPADRA